MSGRGRPPPAAAQEAGRTGLKIMLHASCDDAYDPALMTQKTTPLIIGAILALSLTTAARADAACAPVATAVSVKGTLTGTFYGTDGTATKVKCALTVRHDTPGTAAFDWDTCPGIDTYGSSVFMRAGESYRIVKSAVPQKSCVISNQYSLDAQRMHFVSIGVVTTADTADSTVFVKEKGTLSFTRQDGVFTGKYTANYPKP
jgi:hypothetical protein